MTARVGSNSVLFTQQVEPGQSEEIQVLLAEAKLYQQIAEARDKLERARCLPGWPLARDWYRHWFHERYVVARWYPANQGGGEQHVEKHWHAVEASIGHYSMDSLTPGHLNQALRYLRNDGASHNYVARIGRTLRAMFEDSIRFGWLDAYGGVRWRARHNPMDGVAKMQDQGADRTLLNDTMMRQMIQLAESQQGRNEVVACIVLQATLGLRINEAACLRHGQVGIGEHFIPGAGGFIVWRRGRRKHGTPLRLPIPREVVPYLAPYLPVRPDGQGHGGHAQIDGRRRLPGEPGGDYLFPHPQRIPRAVNATLRESAISMGFPEDAVKGLTSHSLRHSFANALRRADYDVRAIQMALGHASLRTTLTYLQGSKDYMETADAVLPRATALFTGR